MEPIITVREFLPERDSQGSKPKLLKLASRLFKGCRRTAARQPGTREAC